jgi:peptide/nickel transport system permease protein
MQAYIIRRLLLIIPTVFIVTVIIFGLVRLIPGDVIDLMVDEMAQEVAGMGSEVAPELIRQRLGLDVPVHIQYGRWLGVLPHPDTGFSGIFQGDLGRSLWRETSVLDELRNRIPISIELGIMALLIGVTIALPIGVYSAIRQDTAGDYVGRLVAIIGLAIPNFWLGTMIVVYPSIWWNWTPSVEYIPIVENPMGNLQMFLLPALVLGTAHAAASMRITRTMMLEVLRQDYIRTAWSKGLRERTVVLRHALKNALIPVVTQIGMRVPLLISGSVITENIFCLPGVGAFLVQAINQRDYPIISGINLILAGFVLMVTLVIDITYAWLDPRVSYK